MSSWPRKPTGRFTGLGAAIAVAVLVSGCQSASLSTASIKPLAEPADKQGSFSETARLGKAWQASPDNVDTGISYARALKGLGQKARQLEVLAELAKRNPNSARVQAIYGKALVEAGRPAAGEGVLKELVKAGKADWKAYSALGSALDQQGKHAEARSYYQAALKAKPGHVAILNNLAMSHLLEGDLAQAERILRQAYARPEGKANTRIRQNLALAVGLQGRFEEARTIASRDLPPPAVEANMAYLRKMLAQRNSWQKLKASSTSG